MSVFRHLAVRSAETETERESDRNHATSTRKFFQFLHLSHSIYSEFVFFVQCVYVSCAYTYEKNYIIASVLCVQASDRATKTLCVSVRMMCRGNCTNMHAIRYDGIYSVFRSFAISFILFAIPLPPIRYACFYYYHIVYISI